MSEPTRRALPYTWPDITARLRARALDVVRALGVRDKVAGGVIMPLNPRRNDKRPGSFVIWTDTGAWKDYAVAGLQGDVVKLIQYLGKLRDPIDAYWWALDFLNLPRGDGAQQPRSIEADAEAARRLAEDRLAAEAKAAANAEEKGAALFKRWLGLAPILGTVAEDYLREARAIPLDNLERMPGALRFDPALDHFDRETGEVTTWPAIVSCYARASKITGLHRTWLAPDGSGKAPVAKPKKMLGSTLGGAIRLTRGAGGMTLEAAIERGKSQRLVVGEGIETTLTAGCARVDYRSWAAGSLDHMAALEWPACASGVILLRDNGLPDAVWARVESAWAEQANDRPLKTVSAAVGNDINDWARA